RKERAMNYEFAYRIGFHPWEDAEDQPAFVEKLSQLFEREESGREPPYGPALDLGTGSAIWGIRLARRGCEVNGGVVVETAATRRQPGRERSGLPGLGGDRGGRLGLPGAEADRAAAQARRALVPAAATLSTSGLRAG